MYKIIESAAEEALSADGLSRDTALRLINIENLEEIHFLAAHANMIARAIKGHSVELCSIINARSGKCSENCRFCAQSAHNKADITVYPLMDKEPILEAARQARRYNVSRFSIVTSGKGVKRGEELEKIAEMIAGVSEIGLSPCASLGILDDESAAFLKKAGLVSYHHNLETAPAYYPEICTTHSIEDRINTARRAKDQGFRLCCGGIIGLGETREMRVDFALTLKSLQPESVPLNFLNPIPGTPLQDLPALSPMEILKTISVFRLILPDVDIRTCGGREKNLRGLQPMMFLAGANATMTGNYLTTSGRNPQDDIQDVIDLGLNIK